MQTNHRPPNIQPTFYVKQELERIENPNPDDGNDQQK